MPAKTRVYGSSLLLLLIFVMGNAYSDEPRHTLFVLSKDKPYFNKIVNLITADLSSNKDFTFSVLDLNSQPKIESALEDSDIVITLGSSAAEAMLQNSQARPLITTLITKSAFTALAEEYYKNIPKALASGVSAILLDQSFERRLNLAHRLLPTMTDVGVMLGPLSENNTSFYTRSLKALNLQPQILLIDPDKNPIQQLDPVITKSDVFIPIVDGQLINVTTAKWILQLSYRYRVPVIGYSANYVNAGALASVYSSPENVAAQTSDLLKSLSDQGYKNRLYFSKYCTVKYNTTVAWYLGMKLPDDPVNDKSSCDL